MPEDRLSDEEARRLLSDAVSKEDRELDESALEFGKAVRRLYLGLTFAGFGEEQAMEIIFRLIQANWAASE